MRKLIACLALMLLSCSAHAAATFTSVVRLDYPGDATHTTSLTIPSGSGLFLVYTGRSSAAESTFSAVTYNGVTLTASETTAVTNFGGIRTFAAAYSGTSGTAQTLSVTIDAAPSAFGHVYVIVYANPNTSDMIADSDQLDNSTNPAAVTNTSDANALHIAVGYWRADAATLSPLAIQAGNSQTQLEAAFENGNGNTVYGSYRPGAASTATSGFTFTAGTSPQWSLTSWALNGTGGGGGTNLLMKRRRH